MLKITMNEKLMKIQNKISIRFMQPEWLEKAISLAQVEFDSNKGKTPIFDLLEELVEQRLHPIEIIEEILTLLENENEI
jgi:hypothetical protein